MHQKSITARMASLLAILTLSLSSWLAKAQTMELTPTFESIGIELRNNDVNSNSTCSVEFREVGGEWRDGLDLHTDHYTDEKGFRGSIVLLKPDTEYEVKLVYSINGGSPQEASGTVRTWSETFVIAETISINSKEDLERELEALEGRSEESYVVLDGGPNKAEINGTDDDYTIRIRGLKYVILQNMQFTGSQGSSVRIDDSDHIVVQDCEIYKWGRAGAFCDTERFGYVGGGTLGGIDARRSSQIVIQRNTIRDPNSTSCYWGSLDGKDLKKGESDHPAGPRGIALAIVSNSVFRYNEVFSDSQDHYFSDVFNGETSITGGEGTESDIDVYGNEFSNAWDDGIEIEGKNKNIRVWSNVVHHVFQGFASDRNESRRYYGPVYVWRNIFTDLQANPSDRGGGRGVFKLDNRNGKGGIYLFNNTVSGLDEFINPRNNVVNQGQYNLVVKNNIFEVSGNTYEGGKIRAGSDLNYNAYAKPRADFFGKDYWDSAWEEDGQFGVDFQYEKGDNEWDYYAQDNGSSKAQGQGIRIPNFIDPPGEQIDLGAAQKDVWSMCVGPDADCTNQTSNPPPTTVAPLLASRVTLPTEAATSLEESYWADAPEYRFRDATGSSDNEVILKSVWNEEYLLLGVQVNDADPLALRAEDTPPWRNDAVDLLFDPENTGSSVWDTLEGHRQFIIDIAENQYRDPTSFTAQAQRTQVTVPNGKGNLYEIRIPWATLTDQPPQSGDSLGFDVANHDRDLDELGEATRKTQFTYTGRTSQFKIPSRFTTLVLEDEAPAAILAEAATSPITVDGRLDEATWQAARAGSAGIRYAFAQGGSAQTEVWFAWVPDTLYVALRVTDDLLLASADPSKPWRNDGVELLFDMNDNDATAWDATLQGGHKQLVIDIDGHRFQQAEPDITDVTVGQSQDGNQYTMEISIPWLSLAVEGSPEAGYDIGFDMVTNDRDNTEAILANSVTYTGRERVGDQQTDFRIPQAFATLRLTGGVTASSAARSVPGTLGKEGRALVVYPNPSPEGNPRLLLSGFGEQAQVQIVDPRGQVVYRGVHSASRVDLAQHLPRGLYVVRVSDGQGTLTQKLVVE